MTVRSDVRKRRENDTESMIAISDVMGHYDRLIGPELQRRDEEIDRLKQMMWEAYAILGFDTDGDKTYHATVGWPDSPTSFLDCVREELRKDLDDIWGCP